MDLRVVVLASGRGSTFEAIAKAIQNKQIPNAQLIALLTNNPQAKALTIAHQLGIHEHVIDSREYRRDGRFDRQSYEKPLAKLLSELRPDLICLAGYTLLLGPEIVKRWQGKILNIHPSLLPAFRGLRAQKQALEAGESVTGCTVHWVTEELDEGPILAQTTCPIQKGDTEEKLSARLLPLEHQTYIRVLQKLSSERFRQK